MKAGQGEKTKFSPDTYTVGVKGCSDLAAHRQMSAGPQMPITLMIQKKNGSNGEPQLAEMSAGAVNPLCRVQHSVPEANVRSRPAAMGQGEL